MSTTLTSVAAAVDVFYYFICGSMVFLMQLGFAMLEVGTVSKKNINNIIMKGCLDILVGAICFWAVGYTVAFGGDYAGGFSGGPQYAFGRCLDGHGSNLHEGRNSSVLGIQNTEDCTYDKPIWNETSEVYDHEKTQLTSTYHEWFFQFAFAATASTIVSGAVAERTTMRAYLLYSIVLTSFVYPVVVHWQWGGGLTAENGAVDYAGSGVVHMTGGLAAIIGAVIVGPRKGRFTGSICKGTTNQMPQYSVVFQTLGTIILWFGWYGFNTGSTLGITWVTEGEGTAVSEAGLIIMNTTLAPAAAGFSAMLLCAIVSLARGGGFILQVGPMLNGILGGLVSITAGCGDVRPEWAVVIGIIGGFVYVGSSNMQKMLQIDDVIDAGPVHFWCGMWGVIALALFADDRGTGLTGGTGYMMDDSEGGDPTKVVEERLGMGLFYGHGQLLADNLFLIAMIIVWVGSTMSITFLVLKFSRALRVSDEDELVGLDASKHGIRLSKCLGTPGFEAECRAVAAAHVKPTVVTPTAEVAESV